MIEIAIYAGATVFVVLVILFGITSMWKKVPQDKALVITGLKKRVLTGGGGLMVPMFERSDRISLENMKIEVRIDGALTEQGVEIYVDGVSVVKVKSDALSILQAMEQFNTGNEGRTIDAVKNTVRDVLEGKLREIISKLTVEEIYKDREKFASEVEATASVSLAEMGLEIKVFTIRDINDKNQYLESLGKRQIAFVKKEASIAEAEAMKESTIKTTIAMREGEEAKLFAQTQIAEAQKEKELKVQAYRREQEVAKATADNAYEIEANRVRKDVTESAMQVEILRKQKEIELAQQEAMRTEQELEATVRKKADADLYMSRQSAEAQKFREIKDAEAHAQAIELESRAKAEASKIQVLAEAEARAQAITLEGRAKAETTRLQGMAEVDIIRERGVAEADAMAKKAEAYRLYNDAAVTQMIIEKLPEIASSVASPLAKTEKIVIVDSGSGGAGGHSGASKVTGYVTDIISQLPETMKALTGVELSDLLKTRLPASSSASAAAVAASASPAAPASAVHASDGGR
jgi:flotillin